MLKKREWPLPAGAGGNARTGNRPGDKGRSRFHQAAPLPAVAIDIGHDVASYLWLALRLPGRSQEIRPLAARLLFWLGGWPTPAISASQ